MKRLIFLLIIGMTINLGFSQSPIDTTKNLIQIEDSTLTKEGKSGLGKSINKIFGWGKDKDKDKDKEKDEQIESLSRKIKSQGVLIDSMTIALKTPRIVVKSVPSLSPSAAKSIKKDEKFISDLPKSYGSINKKEISKLTRQIDDKIQELISQRDSLIKAGGNKDLIDAKTNSIQSLEREKNVIKLSEESSSLKDENSELSVLNTDLKINESRLKKYLYASVSILFVLILLVALILQRKKISFQGKEISKQIADINKKNNYLEHAARIIRHDMHSGINTYIPRGLSSLEKRLSEDQQKDLKIESPIKMIKEGLNHTQKVYKSVYEFTNLVKQNSVLEKKEVDLGNIISEYVGTTAYSKQVQISDLPKSNVNQSLFCTAVDNLIRNGLQFNDSEKKAVKIYMENSDLVIEDNGRGLAPAKFEKFKKAKETEGLGLSIAIAILEEHGFDLSCEKVPTGTKMKIKITNKQK